MAVTNYPLKTGVGASGGGSDSVLSYADFSSFPVTGSEGVIYIDESSADLYLWDGTVYELQSATGGGDVVGPASAVDNSIPRFDTTTGKLIQGSKISADDDGALIVAADMTGTGPKDMLIFNQPSRINPTIKWTHTDSFQGLLFKSNTTTIASFQDNGFCYFSALGTLGGLNIGNFFVRRGTGVGVEFGSLNFGVGVVDLSAVSNYSEGVFKVLVNKNTNPGVYIKGAASQSANLMEFRDSANALLSSFNSSGLLSYSAGDAGDWDTSTPTTVKAAIDRIAAVVATLNGAPIP